MNIDSFIEKIANQDITEEEALAIIKAGGKTEFASPLSLLSETYTYDEPYLANHLVLGNQVVLGVTHCSLAIDAALNAFPQRTLTGLRKVLFVEPVTLFPGDSATVTIHQIQEGDQLSFKSRYTKTTHSQPLESAGGEYIFALPAIPLLPHFRAILENPERIVEKTEVYAQLGTADITNGRALQTVERVYTQGRSSVGHLRVSDELLHDDHRYEYVHPALLDGALVAGCAVLSAQEINATFIPILIKEIQLFQPVGSACYSYASIVNVNHEMFEVDCWLCNEEGEVLVGLLGFTCKRVNAPSETVELSDPSDTTLIAAIPQLNQEQPKISRRRDERLIDHIQSYLEKKLDTLLGEAERAGFSTRNFMDLGVDSTQLISLVNELEADAGIELYPTLFFEYQDIESLSLYLAQEYGAFFTQLLQVEASTEVASTKVAKEELTERIQAQPEPIPESSSVWQSKLEEAIDAAAPKIGAPRIVTSRTDESFATPLQHSVLPAHKPDMDRDIQADPIAVIGMGGVFPKSPNVKTFWQHLANKTELMSEIPADRFDYRSWYDPTFQVADKMYCRWGSFIDDVDKFDASFFNISPREAELMDPQLRYLLQVLYQTADDAGYGGTIRGTHTGMYVGVCFHDYAEEMMRQGKAIQAHDGSGNAATMLANRPSFIFDLTGPSLAIDTACSSSLFALHYACKALQTGECDMAFAAGVNLLLSSGHYRYFCTLGALSPTGRCHTFDQRADGYVPGEAIASLLLKPLSQAVKDGDQIVGVIKGSAVGHGGYTPSITAPSVDGEAKVILAAWEEAGIDPATLGYIEAHGTGTKLGDPIEIAALTKAFQAHNAKPDFCAIGSAKAHIGHTEGAAGITGVIKALLSIRYGVIPAMPAFDTLNPYIQLDKSPLTINQDPVAWPQCEDLPRRAGVSSFGFGGAYAHLVLEQYQPLAPSSESWTVNSEPQLIVLSAKNEERLQEYAQNLLTFINQPPTPNHQPPIPGSQTPAARHQPPAPSLASIAYTLQTGREAMECRVAFVVNEIATLRSQLSAYIAGEKSMDYLYQGQVNEERKTMGVFAQDEDLQETLHKWILKGKLSKLAELWVSGLEIDWAMLYPNQNPTRVSLPTYPFAKERYWRPETDPSPKSGNSLSHLEILHPLVHKNTSTLAAQRFSSTFNGDEHFFADHQLQNTKVLPGVTYLEMARAAGEMALEAPITQLKDLIWTRPILLEDGGQSNEFLEVQVRLCPDEEEEIGFTVSTGTDIAGRAGKIHSQGSLVTGKPLPLSPLEIGIIRERCSSMLSGPDHYRLIEERSGLKIGPSLQSVSQIWYSQDEALAELHFPGLVASALTSAAAGEEMSGTAVNGEAYLLHPSLMDGVLQVPSVLMGDWRTQTRQRSYLPFAIEEVNILGSLPEQVYVHVTHSTDSYEHSQADEANTTAQLTKFDIALTDSRGSICVMLKGLTYREMSNRIGSSPMHSQTVYGTVEWKALPLDEAATSEPQAAKTLFLVGLAEQTVESVCTNLPTATVVKVTPTDTMDVIRQAWPHLQAVVETMPKSAYQILVVVADEVEGHLYAPLTGLLHTAKLEHPQIQGKTVALAQLEYDDLIPLLKQEIATAGFRHVEVRYDDAGKRSVKTLCEFAPDTAPQQEIPYLRSGGVYWIPGGMGGLGRTFARYLLGRGKQITVILSGREPRDRSGLDEVREQQLAGLNQAGGTAVYLQADISQLSDVQRVVEHIKEAYGQLNGIIHCAGLLRDSLLINKTAEDLEAVLAPKVSGTLNIDAATQDEPLDFMVLFSSITGVLGNVGQADYAAANAFLDAFAHHRQSLVRAGERSGRTLSINWPLWEEGGMTINEEALELVARQTGMVALPTNSGLQAFERAMASVRQQIFIAYGAAERVRDRLLSDTLAPMLASTSVPSAPLVQSDSDEDLLAKELNIALMEAVAHVLKIPIQNVSENKNLNEYGFDSITLTELTNWLNQRYDLALMPTLIFEHNTLASLSQYLTEEYGDHLRSQIQAQAQVPLATVPEKRFLPSHPNSPQKREGTALASDKETIQGEMQKETNQHGGNEAIAIIGMSGRMPGSSDLDAFWQHLANEDDLITEIPPDRWDWRDYYGDVHRNGESKGKGIDQDNNQVNGHQTRAKWGGFISDIDKFDASFFKISPWEAQLMDPQQRLFLETVWHCIEDSGYPASALAGTQTGLFVGVAANDYEELLRTHQADMEAHSTTGMSHSVLANRISYFLDIHGPSQPINTACSSALIAIHRGVEALRSGSCTLAIAGGVNVMLTPQLHVTFSKAGMLAEDGRCKTFDKRADGYVRAEGVGAVLLKPLAQAESDGDHIYAIIRGTAENHGGQAHSLTAPNPQAQADLLVSAYQQANIDPASVSYIEAHGTGTALGDPVEINGLKQAFARLYQQSSHTKPSQPHCGLGAVKSNVGHLESAAGMAGVLKVLLAMRHQTLPATLHVEEQNPYIDLTDSPFYLVTKTQAWMPLIDASARPIPRRAGVSSFGFGGANAHIVLEEYPEKLQGGKFAGLQKATASENGKPKVIVLSAKNEERLRVYAHQLLVYLEESSKLPNTQPLAAYHLLNIAYTLQVGRESMETRLALVVTDIEELCDKLTAYIAGETSIDQCYWGTVEVDEADLDAFGHNEESQALVQQWVMQGQLTQLAANWVKGVEINWHLLYGTEKPTRIPLPTYPFTRERHWIADVGQNGYATAGVASPSIYNAKLVDPEILHPLVHKNISDLEEQRFSTLLTGNEFFLRDHQVQGERVLPGVAYLEMARASAEMATREQRVLQLKDVMWIRPMVVEHEGSHNEGLKAQIGLYPTGLYSSTSSENHHKSEIDFEISTVHQSDRLIHSQGRLVVGDSTTPLSLDSLKTLDISAIQSRCTAHVEGATCYQHFRAHGIAYGSTFQGLSQLEYNQEEALASLRLPTETQATETEHTVAIDDERFLLHPSLLDAALQSALGFAIGQGLQDEGSAFLPFAVETVTLYSELPSQLYAYVQRSPELDSLKSDRLNIELPQSNYSTPGGQIVKYDITLTDHQGNICVALKGFMGRATPSQSHHNIIYSVPSWQVKPLAIGNDAPVISSRDSKEQTRASLLLIGIGEDVVAHVTTTFPEAEVLSYPLLASDEGAVVTKLVQEGCLLLKSAVKRGAGSNPSQTPYPVLVVADESITHYLYAPLVGLLKTARLEAPNVRGKIIITDSVTTNSLVSLLGQEMKLNTFQEMEIRYDRDGVRTVKTLERIDLPASAPTVGGHLKPGGVYWIAGGLGGLGLIFARHLLASTKLAYDQGITVILSGRSMLNEAAQQTLSELKNIGGTVAYLQADVSRKEDVERIIQRIKDEYGPLNGIIHSAGVLRDSLFVNKTEAEIEAVLAPKVFGSLNIDAATIDEPLDFLVLFSSLTGVLGNVGQADYAAANAFLDSFAHYRQSLVEAGKRSGRTLSINWPLWDAGGMTVDKETRDWLQHEIGMVALDASAGISAFEAALAQPDVCQLLVTAGDERKMKAHLYAASFGSDHGKAPENLPTEDLPSAAAVFGERTETPPLLQATERYFKAQLSSVLKMPTTHIDANAPWEKYGFDSILALSLTRQLERHFGELPKTLFFEFQSLTDLARYFVDAHAAKLQKLLTLIPGETEAVGNKQRGETEGLQSESETTQTIAADLAFHSLHNRWLQRTASAGNGAQEAAEAASGTASKDTSADEVAIVGLGGRYPMAENLTDFWENLKAGRDCITEIPLDRWDHRRYYDADKNKRGKSYSKWGGFMPDVDKFDPLFFKISPREAEVMDPQERLFLETVWQTLEDAGYTRQALATQMQGRVGVFVGVMWGEYQLYSQEEVRLSSSYASIANRVSYVLNLNGPSIALDTMCSSSLTSIHLACESIRCGECAAAFAGGVNISIHPHKYLQLAQGKFAASDGRCRSFGEGGDGYVPGEGVGAVLLKPLAQAQADGDVIYGVIKGSSINHGGKTNGYTVPNPVAQSRVIAATLEKSGVAPESISYMEAHGTGTALGDPIEIRGLSQAFGSEQSAGHTCAIGSVKSNIGHLESAAGIAGLTKVLLQIKYQQLVPTIHAETLNPNIEFEATPFRVQKELVSWKQPVQEINGVLQAVPRRAGLSSFGAGGANAHLIIEEYQPSATLGQGESSSQQSAVSSQQLIVLSAKNEERLRVYAQILLTYLEQEPTLRSVPQAINTTMTSQVLEQTLRELVAEMIGVDITEIEAEQTFADCGLDTVQRNRLQMMLEERYGCELPNAFWNEETSIASIVPHLSAHSTDVTPNYRSPSTLNSYPEHSRREQPSASLTNIAYTLQVGREAMNSRLALVVADMDTLRSRLAAYVDQEGYVEDLYEGEVPKEERTVSILAQDEDIQEAIGKWIRKGKLEQVARLWVSGADIDWGLLYGPQKPNRISLPTYPFARERCWLAPIDQQISHLNSNIPETEVAVYAPVSAELVEAAAPLRQAQGAEWLYTGPPERGSSRQLTYIPRWIREPLLEPTKEAENPSGTCLVVYHENSFGFEQAILQRHGSAFQLRLGTRTERLRENSWVVDVHDPAAITTAIKEMPAPDQIYFLGGLYEYQTDEAFLDRDLVHNSETLGLLSLLRLIQALNSEGMLNRLVDLFIFTQNVHRVANRRVQSLSADITGLAYGIAHTFPHIAMRHMDLSESSLRDATLHPDLLQRIDQEPANPRGKPVVLYRGTRFVRHFTPTQFESMDLESTSLDGVGNEYKQIKHGQVDQHQIEQSQEQAFKMNGIYLIVGGAGSIGFALTRELVQRYQAQVIWWGRRKVDPPIQEKIDQIGQWGPAPIYMPVDVTELEQVQTALDGVKAQGTRLNGLIHCGLALAQASLTKMTEAELAQGLGVKKEGSINLYRGFAQEPLDFFCFFSSAQAFSFSGAIDLSHYAAGSTFMDAFAHTIRTKAHWPVITLNWGFWRSSLEPELAALLEARGVGILADGEGFEIFQKSIECQMDQLMGIDVAGKSSFEVEGITEVKRLPFSQPSYLAETLASLPNRSHELTPIQQRQSASETLFDELILVGLARGLNQLGWHQWLTQPLPQAELMDRLQIADKYHRLFDAMLSILKRHGIVVESQNHITLNEAKIAGLETSDLQQVGTSVVAGHSDIRPHVDLLTTCLSALPNVLTGRTSATHVLFPNGSVELVEEIYQGSPIADYFNARVADVATGFVEARQRDLGPNQKIRILEIGAGTGGTSRFVFNRLKTYADKIDYLYTDISDLFLHHAAKTYQADAAYLRFEQFDVEKPLAGQNVPYGQFDIVIAANVLHATRDMQQTLQQAKAPLKQHGILVLNELSTRQDFATLTFGLLDGWWLFEDRAIRLPECPALSAETWAQLLNAEGFARCQFVDQHAYELGQQIIVAESNGIVMQQLEMLETASKQSLVEPRELKQNNRPETTQPTIDNVGSTTTEADSAPFQDDRAVEAVTAWLKIVLSEELKVPQDKLEVTVPLQEFGADSLLLGQLVARIDRELSGVKMDPAMVLAYPTIQTLSEYLVTTYPEALDKVPQDRTSPADTADLRESETGDNQPENGQIAAAVMVQQSNAESQVVQSQPSVDVATQSSPQAQPQTQSKIAVVGMACHFPDAPTLQRYWHNLISGRDSIREVPRSRWSIEAYYDPYGSQTGRNQHRNNQNGHHQNGDIQKSRHQQRKSISKWGAFLADIEAFDPEYFGIPESLAPQIDPLERQWLEVSAEALADAGYGKKDLWGQAVGVFVGSRVSNFADKLDALQKDVIVGMGQNFIAAHLAHIYNFKGPNMVVDTACASSLTAIHLAIQSIRQGECIVALAGGVDILLDESYYLAMSAAQVLSPDGRCKTFDESANGIGIGEGCGVLVLKSLEHAIADGNKIYGVIEDSAINQDGYTMGITTPNPEAQQALVERALCKAQVEPRTITYVETHGTGTLIGDPIELKGLTSAFGQKTDDRQFCGVGSVKSNIGHLLSAAGAASMIKVLLSITHQALPPTIHCTKPNPRFNFAESPFYPVQQPTEWQGEGGIHRAGVSAFGLGGHNAHLIVSDDGIPKSHRADLAPRGAPVVFNRRRYWPTEESPPDFPGSTTDPTTSPTTGSATRSSEGDESNRLEEKFMRFFDEEFEIIPPGKNS
ncbi:MAG: SDR family NAD(P)-dependent oxidoreductase [Chloroflexota bacterium]